MSTLTWYEIIQQSQERGDSDGATGIAGPAGSAGAIGATGATGPAGIGSTGATGPAGVGGGSGSVSATAGFTEREILHDFLDAFTGTPLSAGTTGTASSVSLLAAESRIGIMRCATGTTVTGFAALRNAGASIQTIVLNALTNPLTCIQGLRIPILSDATENFRVTGGLVGSGGTFSTEFETSVYFEYNSTVSPNWLMCSSHNFTRTKTPTNIPVVANTWYDLAFVIASGGTSVEYYIDQVSKGTVTANLPPSTGMHFGTWGIFKVAGIIARWLDVDYVGLKYNCGLR